MHKIQDFSRPIIEPYDCKTFAINRVSSKKPNLQDGGREVGLRSPSKVIESVLVEHEDKNSSVQKISKRARFSHDTKNRAKHPPNRNVHLPTRSVSRDS